MRPDDPARPREMPSKYATATSLTVPPSHLRSLYRPRRATRWDDPAKSPGKENLFFSDLATAVPSGKEHLGKTRPPAAGTPERAALETRKDREQ